MNKFSQRAWYDFIDEYFEKELVSWYVFSGETIAHDLALTWGEYFG